MRLVSEWLRTERLWTCLVVVTALGLWALVVLHSPSTTEVNDQAYPRSPLTGTARRAPTRVAAGAESASSVMPTPENLLIITLDTTRADRLGAYGHSVQTPHLDRLAREGVLFEQTTTAAPLTLPAHGS